MTTQELEQQQLFDLLAKASIRDQQAFKQFYDLTVKRAFSLALRMSGHQALAQDIIQEAYCNVWEKAKNYRPDKGAAISWLLAIVRYRALDAIRADSRRSSTLETHSNDELLQFDHDSRDEFEIPQQDIRRCIKQLVPDQRESILQAFFNGLTHEELARHVAKPIGTVKSRIRRGLAQLRNCLSGIIT